MFGVEFEQLQQIAFGNPLGPRNQGERYHNPETFPLQRYFWDIILNTFPQHPQIQARINDLLPASAVLREDHWPYQRYDCVGFVSYVLDKFIVSVETVHNASGRIIIPNIQGPWDRPYWDFQKLELFGFEYIMEPSFDRPTMFLITLEDEDFYYSQPVHMGIILGEHNSQYYIAHKPNQEYLPEISTLERAVSVYRGEKGSLNETPGIQFWALNR